MSVFIVAEAGVNHLGDRAKMLALCDAAKAAGADAVKFQVYETSALLKGRGQGWEDESPVKGQYLGDFLQQCQLSDADLDAIAAHCKSIGLKWFASVFDPSQIERVLSRGACALKIAEAENGYRELWSKCLDQDCRTWVSHCPGKARHGIGGGVAVLCQPQYPATGNPNLRLLCGPGGGYSGFSSHWQDYRIPAAAALRGAEYIEAHLMLGDRLYAWNGSGDRIGPYTTEEPEREWSLAPYEFAAMVKLIREYEGWL